MSQYKKKLIEVALPLEAINVASAREKQPGIGAHPRGLHQWWARRPQAAARAVIFAQMVDDPSAYVDTLRADPKLKRKAETALKAKMKLWEEARELARKAKGTNLAVPEPGPQPTLDDMLADLERQRLFKIIEDLVLWENTTNETVLQAARDEIWASWRRACTENVDHPRAKELFDRHKLPAFHDPFAGGGALPLEAQRLGLESYASDLNPVAVLINKAMIEIPPKFAGRPPVNPEWQEKTKAGQLGRNWKGAQGLAEDVRYYGKWMRDEAEKRIGQLYPKIEITKEMAKKRPDLKPYVGQMLTVIAWIWARTVKSPNPAFAKIDIPLASSFMLSTKTGKETYIEPVIEGNGYSFRVKVGKPANVSVVKTGTKLSRGANFGCLMSGMPIDSDYIRAEGKAGRMGSKLMAIVAEGNRSRVYLSPTPEQELLAKSIKSDWKPEGHFVEDARAFTPCIYGFNEWHKLFSNRQLLSLSTFSDLIEEARQIIMRDSQFSEMEYGKRLAEGGEGILAYADAVSVYLAFAVDRLADYNSTITVWKASGEQVMHTFTRQALQMTWDYPESNVLAHSAICWNNAIKYTADNLEMTAKSSSIAGIAVQLDATKQTMTANKIVSTDPPYYDNVPYADLSDFFYVWLRISLKTVFPSLFATVAVPKTEELVAFKYRHDSLEGAELFFLNGMTLAMRQLADKGHPAFPVTIYYAFKQSETASSGTTSTGWETFLDAVIQAGLVICGTWPMHTELANRMRGMGSNALASSVILVCRKQSATAPTTTRRDFVNELKLELPIAILLLQRGNIAPVDLAQAAIGPGMAIFTRYSRVLDAEGKALSVRDALSMINQTLDDALSEQEGDFDEDTRWALTWFEQLAFDEGEYGVAEQLSKSKNTSVGGMVDAGFLESSRGKVRLLRPEQLDKNWDPETDNRLTAWEIVHHLIRALEFGGDQTAAEIVAKLGVKAETARELCYRLYTICERKKRATEALSYNALVQSWPEIVRLATQSPATVSKAEPDLFKQE